MMHKTRLALLLLVLLLVAGAFLIPVRCDDGNDDDLHKERSKFESQVSSQGLSYQSELEQPGFHDKLSFNLKCESEEQAKLEFEYQREKDGKETQFGFKLRIYEIIEYKETSTPADGFNPGTDPVISRYRIGRNSTWAMPYLTTVLFDGATVHKGAISTSDGIFTLVVYGSTTGFNYTADLNVPPTSLKFDIDLHNYHYQAQSGSSLALRSAVLYKVEEEVEDHETGEGNENIVVRVAGGGVAGRFEWMNTVTIDGQSKPVYVTKVTESSCGDDKEGEGEDCKFVYFSFPGDNSKDFSYDPIMGLNSAGSLVASLLFTMAVALIALLLLN